ncbi:signal transduction histidine kinase [Arcticibacter tournemirensis]|uniref:histidine kinase n=1 Tax=Arcticibacter tournemirensis TaxID=699437 RepID=A0A5M9HJH1_9SPHI|nr:HAMP domain-containing sensor histidine kinase [Arcticibacter tournemirensis]KAA8485584.1 HAMP domain-containing histidine kinase [Arcticibacter tournemirensis]TQM48699.1 signal transduction histidine kinase [Arcticibacter tournemirensis]
MKLLTKTSRNLLGYACVVLLISIPVFYFIIEQLYYQDVDDALRLKKKELIVRTKHLHTEHDVRLWLGMDQEVRMFPLQAGGIPKDTIYPKLYVDTLDQQFEPYRELRTTLTINNETHLVTIRRSLVESEDLIVGIAEAQAILLILLFGGWIIINRRTSKKIWQPFERIIDWLKKYEMGKDPHSGIPSSGIAEFDTLNAVVSDLIQKNHGVFIQQKQFIENASHEMQTPVAILQSKLDLLIVSEGLTAEQARYLQSQYDAIERLNHLNRSLLLLSQIENHQFEETAPVSLQALTEKILGHLEESISSKNITIDRSYQIEKIVNGNPMLLEICLSNLMTNAVSHTPQDGTIAILLDEDLFRLSNTGEPLGFSEDLLFTRFGKKKGSKYGVGLGLAIVRQIAESMKMKVTYTYNGSAHEFTLVF